MQVEVRQHAFVVAVFSKCESQHACVVAVFSKCERFGCVEQWPECYSFCPVLLLLTVPVYGTGDFS